MTKKPINSIARPGDVRDITTVEWHRFSVLRDHWRQRCEELPDSIKASKHYRFLCGVLETGEIHSVASDGAMI